MADRSISVRLTLDPSNYEGGLQRAARATKGLGDSAKQAETATASAMQRMAQSARDNRTEWMQVGGALTAAGAATTGLMTAVYATGIGYNQLRQSSLAALTTLTGSAEAAAAQMDRLDDFASNSPFARDMFIRAQQQMLGFGIEAQKVIPYLDAIQNAVAAAGGSNHDIAELARIFSQVSASAKITATDLREFGNRGIDAATLIGSQMGMTGAEIRESITAGTLDAGDALDALAAGMATTFDGAAAGVKETFAGAVDRVKAAFRDLSSTMAEPLVGREGGGLLTGLLNQAADTMRAFERLPDPILQAGGALTTVGGIAATAAGGFLLLAPRLVETWDALGNLGRVGSAAQSSLSWLGRNWMPVAAGLTAVAAAVKLYADEAAAAESRVARLAPTLDEIGRATRQTTDELNRAFAETNERFGFKLDSVYDEAQKIGIAFEDLTGYVLGNADAIDRVNAASETYVSGSSLWEHFGQVRQHSVANLTYSLDQWADSLTEAEKRELQMAEAGEETAAMLDQLGISSADAADAQGLLGAATGETTEEVKTQAEQVRELMQAHQDAAGAVLSVREAELRLQEAYEAATEAIEENGATLDVTTEKGRENRRALDDIAEAAWDMVAAADETMASQGELQGIMQTSRDRFIETAEAMGMSSEEAAHLADQLGLIPSNVTARVTVEGIEHAISRAGALDATLNSINGKTVTASVAVRQYGQAALASGGYVNDFMGPLARYATGGDVRRYDYGGPVHGPGTSTSDSILARLSNGEFVQKAAAVQKYGLAFMHAVNQGRYPAQLARGFADGGYASQRFTPSVQYVPRVAPAGGGRGLRIRGRLDLGNGLEGFIDGRIDERDWLEAYS